MLDRRGGIGRLGRIESSNWIELDPAKEEGEGTDSTVMLRFFVVEEVKILGICFKVVDGPIQCVAKRRT